MSALPLASGVASVLAVAVLGSRFRFPANGRSTAGRGDAPDPSDTGPTTRPRRSVVVVAVVVVAVVGVTLMGPGLTVVLGGVGVGFSASRRRRADRLARAAAEAAMPDAIELLVMCLCAGYSPSQAIGRLTCDAPTVLRPAFAGVEQRLHRGVALADALTALTVWCGPCALPLVTSMSAAARDGLPLAPVLDRLSDEASASRRRHGEAAARRLPVRLSFPLVACTLPSFVLLAIAPAVLGALSTLQGSAP